MPRSAHRDLVIMNRWRGSLGAAGRELLSGSRESHEALDSRGRAEMRGFLVPVARARNIGCNTDGTELPQDRRVICGAQCKGGLRVSGLRCAPQRNTSRGEVAAFQEIHPSADEDCNLIWVDMRYGDASCRGRLSGGGRTSGFQACHLRRPRCM